MIDDITNKLKNMNDNELFPCIPFLMDLLSIEKLNLII